MSWRLFSSGSLRRSVSARPTRNISTPCVSPRRLPGPQAPPGAEGAALRRQEALAAGINFRYMADGAIGISLNETVTTADVQDIVNVFAKAVSKRPRRIDWNSDESRLPNPEPRRTSSFMDHPVFNTHRSETQMMRYIRSLERKDVGLDTSMIPLGSCTMKLNAATEMLPVTWEHFRSE